MTCDGFILVPGVAPVARWRSHAQYSAPSRETLDGVNSLARALTAAFCGANQHNHGLLVSWALRSSAAAPRFGAMWLLCCPGIFVRPFHPLTRIKNVITITYRVKKRENTCKCDLKVVLLFHRKGNGPSHNSPAGQEI